MKIIVAADHAGFALKETLKKKLNDEGHQVYDMGTHAEESCDYPDFAKKVAIAVASAEAARGILICGTGIGMSISANRTYGIRAALCFDKESTQLSRAHNDSNILCLGARLLSSGKAMELTQLWLSTPFEGGRHKRRVAKIDDQGP